MATLEWDKTGERFYEVGVDKGVLYVDGVGSVWNGLISVEQSPTGGVPQFYYQDGLPYLAESTSEEFEAQVEAFTYPVAFEACIGSEEIAQGLYISQQDKRSFGLSYQTLIGNDLNELEHGYKIHIVYNCMAGSASVSNQTLGDTTDPIKFKWPIKTRPVKFEHEAFGFKYGAHLALDSREVYPWAMDAVKAVLYGTETTDPKLPSPSELLNLFIDNALLKITDNGDGTWSAEGPDSIISMLSSDLFQINWPSAVYDTEDPNMYRISSL